MGSLVSIVPAVASASYALDDYARQQAEAQYRQRQEQWRYYREQQRIHLAEQRQTAAEEARIGDIRADLAAGDTRRRDALRRAMAAQRARLGARGVDPESGTGEALLLGLVDQAELERAEAHGEARRSLASITADRHWRRKRNLFERQRYPDQQPITPPRPEPERRGLVAGLIDAVNPF
ncbi:MAG: hypothetical protein RID91_10155 [Azospirillaceae bacterium]